MTSAVQPSDPIAGRLTGVIGELGLFFSFGEAGGAPVWSLTFTGPDDPPAQLLISLDSQWVTVSHVGPDLVPVGSERALLALNADLAVAKVGITQDGAWLAAGQIPRHDLDAIHLGEAISAVLTAVKAARDALAAAK